MILVKDTDFSNMSQTNQLICSKAMGRGWKVYVTNLGPPHMFIDRGDNKKLHIFSATPPTMSFAWAHLVDNKFATSEVLRSEGVEQLDVILVGDFEQDREQIVNFIEKHKKVVMKPIDGGHGKGVTVNIDNINKAEIAFVPALSNIRTLNKVIMQKQFVAESIHDIRVLCIAKKFVAALERVPASVIGDGINTIEELVNIENKKPDRGVAYRAKLAIINIELVRSYLGDGIKNILPKGQQMQVLGVANYGQGGHIVDVTDSVPDWMKQQAEKASEALCLDVSGVDFMTSKKVNLDMPDSMDNAVIIEVNKCPALSIHDKPTIGDDRMVTDSYLNFLASL